MKKVTFIGENKLFLETEKELVETFRDIEINYVPTLNTEDLDAGTLYVLSLKDSLGLEKIKHYKFIVVTENMPKDKWSNVARQCYKNGVLDCIFNPDKIFMIFLKVKRFLIDFKYDIVKNEEETVKFKNEELQNIENAKNNVSGIWKL